MTNPLRDQLQATLSGSYVLGRELGGGGMSRVFVAEESKLQRTVVVKVLSPELAAGISAERFQREIRTAASLQQANIVPVLSTGDAEGVPYFTMPFVEGESLRTRLSRTGPVPIGEAVKILGDVARALAYAHERGIVHRDIKPDNVLLSGGTAVVTDFGIAKAVAASRTGAGRSATLTQLGTALGTPAYMAPEQAAGDPSMDHRADFYAFGCTAYELLIGRPPFVEESPQRLLAAHMSQVPEPIAALRPDVPQGLADLVMRCLEKDAARRPASASELIAALDPFSTTSGGSQTAMPAVLLGGPRMFRRALALYAAAFVAVAILAKAAIVGIGLPDWVFPGSLIVMALGLPVILWTAYVQRVARHAVTATPTFTPGGSATATHGAFATMALKAAPHVSWHRTARGGMYAIAAFIVLVAVFMGMRMFGIGPAATLFSAGKLKVREPILMTDFSVTSGDTSLARVVSFAVRTVLSQSPVLDIVDQGRVAAALQRMELPRTARVDLQRAQAIGLREGIKVIVDGEVTPIGASYVLMIRLVTADSLHVLASSQATGDGPQGLIDAADKVGRNLRAKAGESIRSVQRIPPLVRARTASLEALRRYSEGTFANSVENDYPKAVRLLREAVTIDTGFAEGWRLLGQAMRNEGIPFIQSDSAYTRAYRLRGRLPDDEQAGIEGTYYGFGPGRDRARAIAAFERGVAMGHLGYYAGNLAIQYQRRREFGHADSMLAANIVLDSSSQIRQRSLLVGLVNEDRLDSATAILAAMQRRFPGSGTVERGRLNLLWVQDSLSEYAKEVDSARAAQDPTDPAWALHRSEDLALLRGRVTAWRQYRRQALAADSSVGRRPSLLDDAVKVALVQAVVLGKHDQAVAALDSAVARTPLKTMRDADRPDLDVAAAFAVAGRPDRARQVLATYQSEMQDTTVLRASTPAIHGVSAEIALAEGNTTDAVREFRLADRLPDGPVECVICLPANLGRAFDAANQPDSAIAQLERYVQTPYFFRNSSSLDPVLLPMVHERLGQLYEAKGDTAKAVEHDRAFIELWKNADPELQPRVNAARARLRKLTPVERARG